MIRLSLIAEALPETDRELARAQSSEACQHIEQEQAGGQSRPGVMQATEELAGKLSSSRHASYQRDLPVMAIVDFRV